MNECTSFQVPPCVECGFIQHIHKRRIAVECGFIQHVRGTLSGGQVIMPFKSLPSGVFSVWKKITINFRR